MATYPILGIPLKSPDLIPPRQDIDTWWNNPDDAAQQSLFVRALTEFKKLSPLDKSVGKFSYYQIAGWSLEQECMATLVE